MRSAASPCWPASSFLLNDSVCLTLWFWAVSGSRLRIQRSAQRERQVTQIHREVGSRR